MAVYFVNPYVKYYDGLKNVSNLYSVVSNISSSVNQLSSSVTQLSGKIDAARWSELGQESISTTVLPTISARVTSLTSDVSGPITNAVKKAEELYKKVEELKETDEKYEEAKNELDSLKSNEPSYSAEGESGESSAHSAWKRNVSNKETEVNTLNDKCKTLQSESDSLVSEIKGLTISDEPAEVTIAAPSTSIAETGKNILDGNVINTNNPIGTGTKYNLSDSDLAFLGYVAKREQGSVDGAKLELSLMVNLYEKNKSKYSSVKDYVINSGWFGKKSVSNYQYPGDSYVQVAKQVINEGKRYLPSNVVEHDCLSDISSISTGSVRNKSNYVPGKTVIKNVYGARYVFVGFAPNNGDPFGYLV